MQSAGSLRIRIFDVQGNIRFEIPSVRPAREDQLIINLRGLEPGVYLITASDRKGKCSKKFIKMAQ